MRAVLLSAGLSSRLSGGIPKPLLPLVGQTPILNYTIAQLKKLGFDIMVVIGYKAPFFLSTLANSVTFVYNPIYASTASLYSLEIALDAVGYEPLMVCYSDQVTDMVTLRRLVQTPDSTLVTPLTREYGAEYALRIEKNKVAEVIPFKKYPRETGYYGFGGFAFLTEPTLRRVKGLSPKTLTTKDIPMILEGCSTIEGWCENINTPEDLIRVQRILKRGR